ncbi:MAG: trehalose-6-phosphate synthase, partial [Dehalococcoidia bacterium]
MTGRTIIAANRIPYSGHFKGRTLTLERSVGGLATALRGLHDASDSLWIGSMGPDAGLGRTRQLRLIEELETQRVSVISLSREEQEGFYEAVANSVLWPLFHSHLDHLPLQVTGWQEYRAVNARFAAAIAEAYRPGDRVWIHDYQLLLVPRLVRDLVPEARIGFFLHIPFPAPDVFRALPWRSEVIEGLLGADLVGFHIPSYMANFVASVKEIAGLENDVDDIVIGDRSVRTGVFPLGIDSDFWAALGASPEVEELVEANRAGSAGIRLMVGIDRLDYTKGIPRRLLALDRLLEERPDLRGSVRMVQVSVPSREEVESYAQLRSQVDELVGRINGRWGSASWVPVYHIYRGLGDREIAALYRSADI